MSEQFFDEAFLPRFIFFHYLPFCCFCWWNLLRPPAAGGLGRVRHLKYFQFKPLRVVYSVCASAKVCGGNSEYRSGSTIAPPFASEFKFHCCFLCHFCLCFALSLLNVVITTLILLKMQEKKLSILKKFSASARRNWVIPNFKALWCFRRLAFNGRSPKRRGFGNANVAR